MLMKRLTKFEFTQDKVVLILVLVLLALIVGITMRGIFGAINKSGFIDESLLKSSLVRISDSELEDTIGFSFEREYIPLDLPN